MGVYYVSDFLERSPVMSCDVPYGFIQTKEAKYYTFAEEIVIQPWRGQHHVYAIFQIPDGYQYEYLFRLKIPGEDIQCGGLMPLDKNVFTGIPHKQGYYPVRGYLNTRIAINLITKGKLDQLKKLQNWQLGYVMTKKM
ncbi:hypothetical protein H6G14_23410 [Nostoc parmelioides FACHB-3921]|uniref:Uncharacterized protein n=1 Tax=Nostoc parmelioides FACHB-3921 TaxID=2692909 RepID=A0ABR8BJE4_9NOSO|nr:hypothetical protein [Nostoc parmelioides FACHB-3921]